MSWFKRKDKGLTPIARRDVPDGLWIKCEGCGEIIYRKELRRNVSVCVKCGYHFRLATEEYIELLADEGSFDEMDSDLGPTDPLGFKEPSDYQQKLRDTQERTGLTEAAISGRCTVEQHPLVMCLLDFRFMGGSMASVVGEKVARAARRAREERIPLLVVSGSGGARMQEGILSLMQMAKTSAALAELGEAGLPYISLLTNPTTGGVTASFASLGDVNIAEPGALIGFAGPRVIAQTINQELPPGFQRAEFLLEHGQLDLVVPRAELRATLARLLGLFVPSGRRPASPIPLPRRGPDAWGAPDGAPWRTDGP